MATAADKPRESIAWIALAAAPVFALMAVLSLVDGPAPALCSAGPGLLPFDGMTAGDRGKIRADVEDAYKMAGLQSGMTFHSDLDKE